jgi:hypothetical protein
VGQNFATMPPPLLCFFFKLNLNLQFLWFSFCLIFVNFFFFYSFYYFFPLSWILFCIFSAPDEILSDKAAIFTGKVIQSLCRLFKIKKLNSISFRPQTQGVFRKISQPDGSLLKVLPTKFEGRVEYSTALCSIFT